MLVRSCQMAAFSDSAPWCTGLDRRSTRFQTHYLLYILPYQTSPICHHLHSTPCSATTCVIKH